MKDVVERLADAGYTALAPDLCGGVVPADADEAQQLLAESDPNLTASLVLDSIVALRAHSEVPQDPVAVVGFSMGASWALWVATRQPSSVRTVVAYYGAQNIEFDALVALGAVIRGETYHFEVVSNESAAGISRVSVDEAIPIANAVLTTDTDEQAIERAPVKGAEAARVATWTGST